MTGTSLKEKPLARSASLAPGQTWPFLSVVMPVRNEQRYIRRTLEQVLSQDYDPGCFEVIVADGESTDATPAIVRELAARDARLRLVENPKRWSSAGRNLGIKAAQGEIILIVDGHCNLENQNYLRDVADAFARSGADCLGRPQSLHVAAATPVQRAIASARSSWLGHHPSSFIYSGREQFVRPQSVAIAYRRWVFGTVGFFDEQFDACEDVELNHRLDRAGLPCFFTPRIQAHYYPRSGVRGLFKQMARYGRGRARLLRKHPETFTLAGFVPALFLVGIAAGAAASWFSSWAAVVYLAGLAVYGMAIGLTSLEIGIRSRDFRRLPWLPIVFLTIHAGAGVGMLHELVVGAGGSRSRREVPLTREPCLAVFSRAAPSRAMPPARSSQILNALTVDVEDYYHVSGFEGCVAREHWHEFESRVEASTTKILDALERAGVRATFFILGWVAERHPGLVRAIDRAGHEIGCHSYWHRLIYTQSPQDFREDLRRGRDVLRQIIGKPVRAFRAPSFSITRRSLWALDVLIEEGFTVDSSIYPTHHDRYGLPEAPAAPHRIARPAGTIWEFPMAVYRRLGYPIPVGGGGYFRLYPYSVTAHALRSINREGRPFVAYLHPWELDPEQPRLAPGRLRAFRHYVNLHRTEKRLDRLLQDFRFGTISQVLFGSDNRDAQRQWQPARAA